MLSSKKVELTATEMTAKVPAAVARSLYKGALTKVLAIASDARTDADVLSRYTGDTRVSVRHALLHNPSLPYSCAVTLLGWAHSRLYLDMIRDSFAVCYAGSDTAGLRPADLVSCMRMMPSTSIGYYPVAEAAAIISSEGTRDDVFTAWQMHNVVGLGGHLLHEAYRGAGVVSYLELRDRTITLNTARNVPDAGERKKCDAVLHVMTHAGHIDATLAGDYLTAYAKRPGTHRFVFETVDDDALDILLGSGVAEVTLQCLSLGLNSPALTRALQAPRRRLIERLLCTPETAANLCVNQQKELIRAAANDPTVCSIVAGAVAALPHRLDAEEFDLLARGGSEDSFHRWIAGMFYTQQPEPGEILERVGLFDDYQRVWRGQDVPPDHLALFRLRLLGYAAALVDKFGVDSWQADELLAAFDVELGPQQLRLPDHSPIWKLVAHEIERRVGARPEMLETLLGLSGDWEGGLDGLICAAGRIHGVRLERHTDEFVDDGCC